MHIWAGKVLWRVERVEFRTSSSVSPVIYLVRLATSANNSRMQLSMHYLHSNIFNWAGQPAKRRQNWAGKLHSYGFLAYLFSTLQINLHPSNPREWELDTCPASKQRYYHTLTFVFVFKKKTLNAFLNIYNSLTAQMYMFLHWTKKFSSPQDFDWTTLDLESRATYICHVHNTYFSSIHYEMIPIYLLTSRAGTIYLLQRNAQMTAMQKRCLCTMGQSKILD